MCRGGINGDNLFIASAFEPEKKVKDEDVKPEQDDMLGVSRRNGCKMQKTYCNFPQDLEMGVMSSLHGQGKGKGKARAMELDDEDEPVILPYVGVSEMRLMVADIH